MAQARTPFKLVRATADDIDAIATIAGDSFEDDTHTLLKAHWRGANDHRDSTAQDLAGLLDRPGVDMIVARKGVDGDGDVIGFVVWHKRGLDDTGNSNRTTPPLGDDPPSRPTPLPLPPPPVRAPPGQPLTIDELAQTNSAAMTHYVALLLPPGARCRFVSRMSVTPGFQGQGVGSALLRWGTDRADAEGVYCWVSSSMDGYHVFEKAGFAEVGRLALRLDDYAQGVKRRVGGREEDWGMYVWRWMRREPRASA